MTRTLPVARTVVVGVDSSPGARAALVWAATWPTLTGAQLRAIHAITPKVTRSPSWYPVVAGWASCDDTAADDRERLQVTRMFDEVHPRQRWTLESVHGPAGQVLVEACVDAGLLVVGTRRLGGLSRVLEGSVSEYGLRHAPCPVAVVPALEELQPTSGQHSVGPHRDRPGESGRVVVGPPDERPADIDTLLGSSCGLAPAAPHRDARSWSSSAGLAPHW